MRWWASRFVYWQSRKWVLHLQYPFKNPKSIPYENKTTPYPFRCWL